MNEKYISDEEFEALSEKEQVQVLIDMIKDAPHDELILLKNVLDKMLKFSTWESIKEEEPDEIDLQMLHAIDNDPECHEFVKESEINWN